MRGYSDHNPHERYAFQASRQALGLPCSDCGSSQGHFGFCPLFHKGLPRPTPIENDDCDTIEDDEITMEQVLGHDKPQPDSQSFYRRAQSKVLPEDYKPRYSISDRIIAHALGVSLEENL